MDEKTRQKIDVVGSNTFQELSRYMDPNSIPDFLGGPNKTPLIEDHGPWNDFEVVDGCKEGDLVGVRRKSEGVNGRVFTHQDFDALPNNILKDPNISVKYYQQRIKK